jgi:4-hydroxy 2-oxovalerate aldolase
MVKILDCTLRDGGYYTHWDFEEKVVEKYLKTMSMLPIEYVELGYRSTPRLHYEGEFCYLPVSTLKKCKSLVGDKRLAVMVNLNELKNADVVKLLTPCIGLVDLIRLAVRPEDVVFASDISTVVRSMGFIVAANIMYMSEWNSIPSFFDNLKLLRGKVDAVWMVDSFGAVFPDEIPNIVSKIKKELSCPLGFHGHHNIELSFANSLQALNSGCEYIDSTITGIGRGAGNLKTELFLTYLSKRNYKVDFYRLSNLVSEFQKMQNEYGWGVNLPYMISGVNSLPQKDIMEMMSKRRYSVSSIVARLQHLSSKQENDFSPWDFPLNEKVVLIGGGESIRKHKSAVLDYIKKKNVSIVFTSSKHIDLLDELQKKDCDICLIGQEGRKFEDHDITLTRHMRFVVNQFLDIDTYVPDSLRKQTFALSQTQQDLPYSDSPLTMALQLVGIREVLLVGFDGYTSYSQEVYDLMVENQTIIDAYIGKLISLLPTVYKNVSTLSIYSYE